VSYSYVETLLTTITLVENYSIELISTTTFFFSIYL